jgi:hypothetical protein
MVNTFIPHADFKKCAKVLDNKRLGKQRVEAKQILNILTGATKTRGWRSHPVVAMWNGYEKALMHYYNIIVAEWIKRGFQNNMPLYVIRGKIILPWFIGNKTVHLSHQANLIRKNAAYYSKFFKNVPDEYIKHTYVWPSKLSKEQIAELKENANRAMDIKKYTRLLS